MSVTASMLWHKCESSWLLQYKHAGPHAGRLRERLILRAAETHRGCQLKHRKEPREQNTEQRNEKSCETKVSLQSIDHEESGFWPNRARSRRPACVSAGWANQMVRFSKETQAVLHTAKKSSRFVDSINVWCRSFLWETTRLRQWCLLLKIPTVTQTQLHSLFLCLMQRDWDQYAEQH